MKLEAEPAALADFFLEELGMREGKGFRQRAEGVPARLGKAMTARCRN
ncbi:MAG: hypothetical protein V1746_05910 [bacterium]